MCRLDPAVTTMFGGSGGGGKRRRILAACLLLELFCPLVVTVPLEAAFQGRCEDGNPCDQNCFNLHDKMYECDCNEGFYLHTNGYNCVAFNLSESGQIGEAITQPNIAIQIEVDIEPPEEKGNLNADQLAKLGLPPRHIHYSSGEPGRAELLAPEDIQVSYTLKDEYEDSDEADWRAGGRNDNNINRGMPYGHQPEDSANLRHGGSHRHSGQMADGEEVDPPRALPAIEAVTEWAGKLAEDEQVGRFLGESAAAAPLADNIYTVPAFCSLDCGSGTCHTSRLEGGDWESRCLCPVGLSGSGCNSAVDTKIPHLSGLSYLALPTLQNAYSDLHLAIEFRPTANSGLLLITGETEDMTGDYLAILLKEGFVELRLDCGTGPGVVRSSSQVHLNEWNHLSVFRHDWGMWIQLNGGKQEEGRSQGLFSRITFNQPVYVGGGGSIRNIKSFLGQDQGFQGCVRNLEINQKLYSLVAREDGGDVIGGQDIGSCIAPGCSDSLCGEGRCRLDHKLTSSSYLPTCECPLGMTGKHCEKKEEILIPSFPGGSYLRYSGLGEAGLIWLELEIVFKPTDTQGLILYNGDRNNGRGDFMAVFLNGGYVEFAFDLGNGIAIARSSNVAEVNQWHRLTVSRTGREAYLTLDGIDGALVESPGGFTQLSLTESLWLGGVPDYTILSTYLPIINPYLGCIQKVVVNGLPLDLVTSAIEGVNILNCNHSCLHSPCGAGVCQPLLESFSCDCPMGWEGELCDYPESQESPIPAFAGDSYLYFTNQEIYQNLVGVANSINIRLRITGQHGVILWAGGAVDNSNYNKNAQNQDYILLGVDRGFLQFSFNVGGGEMLIEYNSTRIDDGLWHRIRATRMEQTASLLVDNGDVMTGSAPGHLNQLNTNTGLFLGGADVDGLSAIRRYRTGITGCIAELSIGNMANIRMLHLAEKGRNIDTCYAP